MSGTTTDPAPPAGQDAGLASRVSTIEDEQKRQGGMLEQILARLPGQGGAPAGGAGGTGGAPAGGAAAPLDLAAVQQQVRDEIAAADKRRAAEQAETKWRDDVNGVIAGLRRERQPREPETGVRAAVQRMLIGRQQ